jgi:hypothetical protein
MIRIHHVRMALFAGLTACLLTGSIASAAAKPSPKVPIVPARTEDVATLDGIIGAFYDVISGPKGAPRQWARDRSLYIDGVRFVAVEHEHGHPKPKIVSHEGYVRWVDADMVKQGFFEHEIHREVRRFGDIAQVFSTYEWRETTDGPVKGRGINSIELYYDGKRWWIAGATWQDEAPDLPLPKEYLP